ncbi:hypothetical protein ABIC50_000214 [Burkholderia sp. 567]
MSRLPSSGSERIAKQRGNHVRTPLALVGRAMRDEDLRTLRRRNLRLERQSAQQLADRAAHAEEACQGRHEVKVVEYVDEALQVRIFSKVARANQLGYKSATFSAPSIPSPLTPEPPCRTWKPPSNS